MSPLQLLERVWLPILILLSTSCKTGAHEAPGPPLPSRTAAQVFELARADAGQFENVELQVKARVLAVRWGEDVMPSFVDLDAGQGRKLIAAMKAFGCLRGTCFKPPPAVGSTATLRCVGREQYDRPALIQCEQVAERSR